MYERPTLTEIGEAKEVIRGLDSGGYDMDNLRIMQDHEFQYDPKSDSMIAG